MPDDNQLIQYLADVELALANARLPRVQVYLATIGYGPAGLDEGDARLAAAQQALEDQNRAEAERLGAVDAARAAWAEAQKVLGRHLAIARIVFRDDPERLRALGLRGRRARDQAGWLGEARRFYDALDADADARAALALASVPAEDLAAGRTLVVATEAAFRKQAKAHGARVAATARKQKAEEALRGWMVPFRALATIACAERPQLIEALGWRVRS